MKGSVLHQGPLDSIEWLEAFSRDNGPGRYDVDEHSLDLLPETKVSSKAWGKMIHHHDGKVIIHIYSTVDPT